MAKVCNPIYDTVFKYLMEDERVAKVLLGSILNKKIVAVEILELRKTVYKAKSKSYFVM